MTRTTAKAVILLLGFVGAMFHGAITLLVTLGMSLGRQSDDPWNPLAEWLMAISFYGTFVLLLVLLALVLSLRPGVFWLYTLVWLTVTGSFLGAISVEASSDVFTHPMVIATPAVAMSAVLITYWVLRPVANTE